MANNVIHALAIVATFNFVCFTMLFFSGRADLEWNLVRMLSAQHLWGAAWEEIWAIRAVRLGLAIGLPALAILLWKRESLLAAADRWQDWVTQRWRWLYLKVSLQVVLAVVVFFVLWGLDQQDPVVAYMRF